MSYEYNDISIALPRYGPYCIKLSGRHPVKLTAVAIVF